MSGRVFGVATLPNVTAKRTKRNERKQEKHMLQQELQGLQQA